LAGAAYRQRQDSRKATHRQHLISTVEVFLGANAADKVHSQRRGALTVIHFVSGPNWPQTGHNGKHARKKEVIGDEKA
jgi:hypothetical protein